MITSTIVLGIAKAFAYGFSKEFDRELNHEKPRGLLIFNLKDNEVINYCIRIDSSIAWRFNSNSIAYQTEVAAKTWLDSQPEIAKKHVGIRRVECDDSRLNLIVDVGPERNFTGSVSYEQTPADGNICSLIKINTDFSYSLPDGEHGVFDFGALDMSIKGGKFTYQQYIQMGLTQHMSAQDLLITVQNQGITKFTDEAQIRMSTWPLILHEFGHYLGLCDVLDQDSVSRSCIKDSVTHTGFDTVMGYNGDLYLSADDINGLNAVYFAANRRPTYLR